ncbi:MAG: FAD-binding oxidoreductase [Pirellulales bacterium]|nr:FAD-binding oxidoreductase [Pirellulales bacterium]
MNLPWPNIREVYSPDTVDAVAQAIRAADADNLAVYPLGGETALADALVPRVAGVGISTKKLAAVVDYPARDLTITVGAGITISELLDVLATEGQTLPVDISLPHLATLGGAIATNTAGPRRVLYGTLRDYVIGIEAVDGAGRIYHGGGRVVKNVAGYDFCRLLVGSVGLLGIITQVTLKVQPLPQASGACLWKLPPGVDLAAIFNLLHASPTRPAVLDVVGGNAWSGFLQSLGHAGHSVATTSAGEEPWLICGFEGTIPEVNWQLTTITQQLYELLGAPHTPEKESWVRCLHALRDFAGGISPGMAPGNLPTDLPMLTQPILKFCVRPSQAAELVRWIQGVDPAAHWQLHAANGILYVRFSALPSGGWSKWLLQQGHPHLGQLGGRLRVWRWSPGMELTQASAWGPRGDGQLIEGRMRAQFDPRGRLNSGRFW